MDEIPLGSEAFIRLERPAPVSRVFARGLWAARGRQQGVVPAGVVVPRIVAVRDGVEVGFDAVRRFVHLVRAETPRGVAPATWPEVLFLEPLAALVTHPEFPLSPLGLIHIEQSICQRRALRVGEQVDAWAHLASLHRTPRGVEVGVDLRAAVGDEQPWEGRAVFLSRAPGVGSGSGHPSSSPPSPLDAGVGGLRTRRFDAQEDAGRRYAAVSGDWNPHHLWRATARPLGYRQPIAHGMWTLARVVAEMERDAGVDEACRILARFKRPLPLPGRAELRFETAAASRAFELRAPKTHVPYLTGRLENGTAP